MSSKTFILVISLVVLFFADVSYAQSVPLQYEIVDLNTLGGNESRGLGLNNLGHVVGESLNANGQIHAFL